MANSSTPLIFLAIIVFLSKLACSLPKSVDAGLPISENVTLAPTDLTAVGINDNVIKVKWKPPENQAGVTGFEISLVRIGLRAQTRGVPFVVRSVDKSVTGVTFSELDTFTKYNVSVKSTGESASSASISTIAYTLHSTTDIVKVEAVNETAVNVGWKPPQSVHAGDKVFAFTTDGQSCESSTDSSSCMIEGLNAAKVYKVCVTVCHAESSSETTTSPPTPPPIPTKPFFIEFTMDGFICSVNSCDTIQIANFQLDARTSHSLVISTNPTDETIKALTDNKEFLCNKTENVTCLLDGLSPYTEYNVTLQACGNGQPSSACTNLDSKMFKTLQEEPKNVVVEALNVTIINLIVEAPENRTGVDHFELKLSKVVGSGTEEVTTKTCPLSKEANTTCGLDNLIPGTKYVVTVRSCDSAPIKICSLEKQVSFETVLSAPTDLIALGLNDSAIRVSWKRPVQIDGINWFKVSLARIGLRSQNRGVVSTVKTVSASQSKTLFTELDPFTEYNISIQSLGSNIKSDPVFTTGYTLHGTTDIVKVVAVNTTAVKVEWKPLQSVHAEDKVFAFTTDGQSCESSTDSSSCTIEGLNAAKVYEVCVAVCHDNSSSETTTSEPGSHPTTPPIPTKPFFKEFTMDGFICSVSSCCTTQTASMQLDARSSHSLMISTNPSSSADETFQLVVDDKVFECNKTENVTCLLDGLSPYTDYNVTLQACSNNSTPTCKTVGSETFKTLQEEPKGVTAAATSDTTLNVNVTAPENTTGVDHFLLRVASEGTGGDIVSSCPLPQETTTSICQVENLQPFTQYQISVTSCDADNETCSLEAQTSARTLLSEPKSVIAVAKNDATLLVSVESPATPAGIDHYELRMADGSSTSCPFNQEQFTVCQLNNLQPYTRYEVNVTSCDANSEACSLPAQTSARTLVSSPLNFEAKGKDKSIKVSWTAPAVTTGIASYLATATKTNTAAAVASRQAGDSGSCAGNITATECSIEGLAKDTEYNVTLQSCDSARVCSEVQSSVVKTHYTNLPLILGLSIGIPLAVLLLLLILLLILCRKRLRNCCKKKNKKEEEEGEKSTKTPANKTPVKTEATKPVAVVPIAAAANVEAAPPVKAIEAAAIPVANAEASVAELSQVNEMQKLFTTLKSVSEDRAKNEYHLTQDIARDNLILNRYTNILPYDQTLVILGRPWSVARNDTGPVAKAMMSKKGHGYINASYIRRPVTQEDGKVVRAAGYEVTPEYIATQGPGPHTIADFLTMAYEQRAPLIVMLCRCTEKNLRKCEPYWGDEKEELRVLNFERTSIRVKTLSQEQFAHGTIRYLQIRPSERTEARKVKQIQFEQWPDFGTIDAATLYDLVQLSVDAEAKCADAESGPTIVHCSAGVGRSGVLMAARFLLDQLRTRPKYVDVLGTLLAMRQSRVDLVQTPEQLQLLYKFVAYCIKKENLDQRQPVAKSTHQSNNVAACASKKDLPAVPNDEPAKPAKNSRNVKEPKGAEEPKPPLPTREAVDRF